MEVRKNIWIIAMNIITCVYILSNGKSTNKQLQIYLPLSTTLFFLSALFS